jgi:hypothetical protein
VAACGRTKVLHEVRQISPESGKVFADILRDVAIVFCHGPHTLINGLSPVVRLARIDAERQIGRAPSENTSGERYQTDQAPPPCMLICNQ